jgi:transposase
MNVMEIERHGSLSVELDGGVTALPHVGSTATSSGVAQTGWLQFDEALEANDRTAASDQISAKTRRFRDSSRLRIITSRASSARVTGATVSLVARRHGVAPNQLFTWRRLVAQGALTATGSGEEVVPASDYRALQSQVRELHRLLGKKTLEAEILKEVLEHATGSKKRLRLPPLPPIWL